MREGLREKIVPKPQAKSHWDMCCIDQLNPPLITAIPDRRDPALLPESVHRLRSNCGIVIS